MLLTFLRILTLILTLKVFAAASLLTNSLKMKLKETKRIVDLIQDKIFGDDLTNFPKSLSPREAGSSCIENQHRYLWTDSFGVLNYLSQYMLVQSNKETFEDIDGSEYLLKAKSLIDMIYRTLGAPANDEYPMKKIHDDHDLQYAGLRIGKVNRRKGMTDVGMQYDGMYSHYIDKFIFAVQRYVYLSNDKNELKRLIKLIHAIHPLFLVPERGYQWKINTDGSSVPVLRSSTHPTHDALTSLICYKLVDQITDTKKELVHESTDLEVIVRSYLNQRIQFLVSNDELGIGMILLTNQFLNFDEPQKKSQLITETANKISKEIIEANVSSMSSSLSHSKDLNFRLYGALIGAQLNINDVSGIHGRGCRY